MQEEYPMVFSLAFGEGVVNDAVAVVLAGAVSELGTEVGAAPPRRPGEMRFALCV
jgi:hypothetical protein